MVQTYIPKRQKRYADDAIQRGLQLMNDGVSLRKAARWTCVPIQTLIRWFVKEPSWEGSGRFRTVLTAEEEQLVVIALQTSSWLGWPCGPEEVKLMIKSYLDSQNKKTVFKDNTPGEDWMLKFKKKYFEQMRIKYPEVLTLTRVKNLSDDVTANFFELVHN